MRITTAHLQRLAELAQGHADACDIRQDSRAIMSGAEAEALGHAAEACWDAFDSVCAVHGFDAAYLRDRFFDNRITPGDLCSARSRASCEGAS